MAKALSGVNIETKGFASVLGSAKLGDLVYFDPPYHPVSETANFTAYSKGGFPESAQRELRDVFPRLTKRGVKTVLSNSMTDFTCTLYKDYFIYRVFANRVVNSRADRRQGPGSAYHELSPIGRRGAHSGTAYTASTRYRWR